MYKWGDVNHVSVAIILQPPLPQFVHIEHGNALLKSKAG